MAIKETLRSLIDELNYHTKLYDEGHPIISDKEWDDIYFRLQKMEKQTGIILEDSPTHHIDYQVVNGLEKVTHNHDMLSLAKTKDMKEVRKFLGTNKYITMCKMDGLTCSLRYANGKLVSAETRGNGYVGENVYHNALVVPSIPKRINYKEELIVDGEIICKYSDFESFSSEYKNARNFAAGSIRLLDSQECAKRKLTFVAWEVIKGFEDVSLLHDKFEKLKELNFEVVPWISDSELDAKETIQQIAQELSYPIDGLVFKFDDVEYGRILGKTAHHGKNAIAFKFYDELYETTLRAIEWQIGRSGIITPVAIFEPVEIDFTTVERASLHNISVMEEILGVPYFGQKVWITKRNMIIPQIEEAEKSDDESLHHFKIPTVCPDCGHELEIKETEGAKFLTCVNKECAGQRLEKLTYFASKSGLDIKNVNEILIAELGSFGFLQTYKDFFELKNHYVELINKPNWGTRGTKRLLDSIETARKTTLDKFISAIGIPLVGPSVAKDLAKVFATYDDFRNAIETGYDFTQLDNFGEAKHLSISNYNYKEADVVSECLEITNDLIPVKSDIDLSPYKFVITGSLNIYANRDELVNVIESYGGTVAGSVSRRTSYLINNDLESTTGKNRTAKNLGIPIITEEEFIHKFLEKK